MTSSVAVLLADSYDDVVASDVFLAGCDVAKSPFGVECNASTLLRVLDFGELNWGDFKVSSVVVERGDATGDVFESDTDSRASLSSFKSFEL